MDFADDMGWYWFNNLKICDKKTLQVRQMVMAVTGDVYNDSESSGPTSNAMVVVLYM